MKSMNHLNKVLLVSFIVLPFTSSESLAGWFGWGSKTNSKPSLVSRAYDNKVVSAVVTQARKHPSITSQAMVLTSGSLAGVLGKSLYDRCPTFSNVSSKAKACGSWIKNNNLYSGIIGTAVGTGLLALDFWKKPMGGNSVSANIARGLYSLLNNHKGLATGIVAASLGWYGSSLIGKQQNSAAAKQVAKPSVHAQLLTDQKEIVEAATVTPQAATVTQQNETNGQSDQQISVPAVSQLRVPSQPVVQPAPQVQSGRYKMRGPVKHDTRTCSCVNCTRERSSRR